MNDELLLKLEKIGKETKISILHSQYASILYSYLDPKIKLTTIEKTELFNFVYEKTFKLSKESEALFINTIINIINKTDDIDLLNLYYNKKILSIKNNTQSFLTHNVYILKRIKLPVCLNFILDTHLNQFSQEIILNNIIKPIYFTNNKGPDSNVSIEPLFFYFNKFKNNNLNLLHDTFNEINEDFQRFYIYKLLKSDYFKTNEDYYYLNEHVKLLSESAQNYIYKSIFSFEKNENNFKFFNEKFVDMFNNNLIKKSEFNAALRKNNIQEYIKKNLIKTPEQFNMYLNSIFVCQIANKDKSHLIKFIHNLIDNHINKIETITEIQLSLTIGRLMHAGLMDLGIDVISKIQKHDIELFNKTMKIINTKETLQVPIVNDTIDIKFDEPQLLQKINLLFYKFLDSNLNVNETKVKRLKI